MLAVFFLPSISKKIADRHSARKELLPPEMRAIAE